MVILDLFVCSFPITSVLSQNTTSRLIQMQGEILYASPSTPQTQLRVNGIYLEDGSGNRVRLKGMQVCWNGRMKLQGSTGTMASSPSASWFTLADVQRMKNAGGNCIEIHGLYLTEVMPAKNVPNEAFFATWVDTWGDWCAQNHMYCILTIAGMHADSGWATGMTIPNWIWSSLYSTPSTKAHYDQIIRDFFDTSVAKQDSNRAAFINLWGFIANRYKSNPYVMFGIMNEPFNYVAIPDTATSIHLGQTYSTFMGQVVDGIRNAGCQKITFIDHPFLQDANGWFVTRPINKGNIVWEVHEYITPWCDLAKWKTHIDNDAGYYNNLGKPVFIGEYGFDPPTAIHTTYPSTWQSLLSSQVSDLDGHSGVVGRDFHAWDYMYGKYSVAEGESDFTAAESIWIIQTVLG